MIYLHRETYIGRNLKEYMVVIKQTPDASTWSVYLTDKNSIKKAVAVVTNRPSVAILNNVIYVGGDANTIKFAYYDSDDVYHSGTMSNAPQGEFLVVAKNRLFLGGKTTVNYTTGRSTFTQSSSTVTGTTYSTGTVTFTKDSATVAGSGTAWDTGTPKNAVVGSYIGVGAVPTKWYKIRSVESDTSLTIDTAYVETTASASAYIISETNWEDEIRAGDMIGTGANPTTWYQVKKITNNYTLSLSVVFAESTATNAAYKTKRTARNIIYHSAKLAYDDWIVPGVYGGDDAGFLALSKPNTGLHEFEDALILFTEDQGYFISGNDVATWQAPKQARFPVGCISHGSIASKNGYLTFTSRKGIFVTKGGSLRLDALEAESFSSIIQRSFDFIDQDRSQYIYSYPYKDFLYVSAPSTDEYSSTDTNLIYNTGTVEVAASSSYSTGTITLSENGVAVTGSGTLWLNNVDVGDLFGVGADPSTFYLVAEISTDTGITLATPYTGSDVSGNAYLIKKQKTVTGTDTEWLNEVYPGDGIKFGSSSTYYDITAISDDTTITLADHLATDYAAGTTYTIQKRRNNKILALDTRTGRKGKQFGWTILDGVNATSFAFYNSNLYYGSSIDNYIYQLDIGGLLYDSAFTAFAKQKRTNCGYDGEKFFKAFLLKARGNGTVYVTPYVDGVAGEQCDYTFDTGNNTEEIYFPRKESSNSDNKFSYIGHEIQYYIECTGRNEEIYVYPIQTGWLPMKRR